MAFRGLICWHSVSWFCSSEKKVTHDKLHALDTTKNNRFIHSKNGAFFLSILYFRIYIWKKSVSADGVSVALHSHDPIFLFTQKRLSKKKSVACIQWVEHTMCVPWRSTAKKKEMKMFAFSTWRDHLVVVDFSLVEEWSKSYHISRVISLNIKTYLAWVLSAPFKCVWEFYFSEIQRKTFFTEN